MSEGRGRSLQSQPADDKQGFGRSNSRSKQDSPSSSFNHIGNVPQKTTFDFSKKKRSSSGSVVDESDSKAEERTSNPKAKEERINAARGFPRIFLNTKRKLDATDEDLTVRDSRAIYSGQPDSSEKDFITCYYLWPEHESPYDMLGGTLQLLDDVRRFCRTYIAFDASFHCLVLHSEDETSSFEAVAGTKAIIRYAKSRLSNDGPLYLVDPPLPDSMRTAVKAMTVHSRVPTGNSRIASQPDKLKRDPLHTQSLDRVYDQPAIVQELSHDGKPDEIDPPQNTGRRSQLILKDLTLVGPFLDEAQKAQWSKARVDLDEANRSSFFDCLKRTFSICSGLRAAMRLRVHFGHWYLLQYRKSFGATAIPFLDFTQLMGESRTVADFEKKVGGDGVAATLISAIKTAPQMFTPADSWTTDLTTMEPKHSLVILLPVPDRSQLRLEADLDPVNLNRPHATGRKRAFQPGALRAVKQSSEKNLLDVGVLNLESKYDWKLCLRKEDTIDKLPLSLRNMFERDVFTEVETTEGLRLPIPNLKSTSHIPIDEYLVEITVYHSWRGHHALTSPPENACGISFYGREWGDTLEALTRSDKVRVWGSQLENIFGGVSTSNQGFSNFLEAVQSTQAFVEKTTRDFP